MTVKAGVRLKTGQLGQPPPCGHRVGAFSHYSVKRALGWGYIHSAAQRSRGLLSQATRGDQELTAQEIECRTDLLTLTHKGPPALPARLLRTS